MKTDNQNKKTGRKPAARKPRILPIIKNDPWLEPYTDAINGRHQDYIRKLADLTVNCKSLTDFANAHKYFGR